MKETLESNVAGAQKNEMASQARSKNLRPPRKMKSGQVRSNLTKTQEIADKDEKRSQAMEDIVDTRDIVDTKKTLKADREAARQRLSFASSFPVHHSPHGAAPRPTSWASRSLTKAPVHLLPVTKKANSC